MSRVSMGWHENLGLVPDEVEVGSRTEGFRDIVIEGVRAVDPNPWGDLKYSELDWEAKADKLRRETVTHDVRSDQSKVPSCDGSLMPDLSRDAAQAEAHRQDPTKYPAPLETASRVGPQKGKPFVSPLTPSPSKESENTVVKNTDTVRTSDEYHAFEAAKRRRIEASLTDVLGLIGLNIEDPELKETPRRVCDLLEEFSQQRDLKEVLGNGFSYVKDGSDNGMVIQDTIPFRGLCLDRRTVVYTEHFHKQLHQVEVGDQIWTTDNSGQPVLTNVTQVTKSAHQSRYIITISNGRKIKCSGDHPFMTESGWVKASDLSVGSEVGYYNPRLLSRTRVQCNRGYHFGYVLGALAGDGYVESTKGQRVAKLQVRDAQFASNYAHAFKEVFGFEPHIRIFEQAGGFIKTLATTYAVQTSHIDVIDQLEFAFGGKKRWDNVIVPPMIKNSPEEIQGFIDGLWDADGTMHGYSRRITGCNKVFLQDVASLGDFKMKDHSDPTFNESFVLLRNKYEPQLTEYSGADKYSKYKWLEVVSIETEESSGTKPFTMYDLSCSPFPHFLAGGYHVHNCAHHWAPFHGIAAVGYLPRRKMVGLSKLTRLVQAAGTLRPSNQEFITNHIADVLHEWADGLGVIVVTRAQHTCMCVRGINSPGVYTTVSATRGVFLTNPAAKSEFLQLASLK